MIVTITVLMFINLILMSTTDLFFRRLYNTNNIILLALGITNLITKPENWILALSMFGVMLVVLITIFLVSKEGTIGGGDVKMLGVSMLFLNSFNILTLFIVLLSVFSLVGIIVAKIKKEHLLKYGLIMAPSLMYSYALAHFEVLPALIIVATFSILQVVSVVTHKYLGGRFDD